MNGYESQSQQLEGDVSVGTCRSQGEARVIVRAGDMILFLSSKYARSIATQLMICADCIDQKEDE